MPDAAGALLLDLKRRQKQASEGIAFLCCYYFPTSEKLTESSNEHCDFKVICARLNEHV